MNSLCRRVLALALAGAAIAGSGCSTILAVREQQRRADQNAVISGTVTTDHEPRGPIIVGILAQGKSGPFLLDHFVTQKPGPWIFAVEPGTYWLAAFEDINGDGRYDEEPALRSDPNQPIALASGQKLEGVKLRIPLQGRFTRDKFTLSDLQARDTADQDRVSVFALSVAGQVTTLADPRFSREVATKGMWQFYDFLLDTRPGIYFLQEYDPKKIPVLFVHGIAGTPLDFAPLIDRLDRTRFQPWVFYYPSGARLESLAALLTQLFVRLRVQYGFDRAAVVAHSMGGLVTRGFLLQDYDTNAADVVRAYVTISSPLGGMASAGKGVEIVPDRRSFVVRAGPRQRVSRRTLLRGPGRKDQTPPPAQDHELSPAVRISRLGARRRDRCVVEPASTRGASGSSHGAWLRRNSHEHPAKRRRCRLLERSPRGAALTTPRRCGHGLADGAASSFPIKRW